MSKSLLDYRLICTFNTSRSLRQRHADRPDTKTARWDALAHGEMRENVAKKAMVRRLQDAGVDLHITRGWALWGDPNDLMGAPCQREAFVWVRQESA